MLHDHNNIIIFNRMFTYQPTADYLDIRYIVYLNQWSLFIAKYCTQITREQLIIAYTLQVVHYEAF